MTFPTIPPLTLSVITAAFLTACGETQPQLAKAQNASCTELAREIGKNEQQKERANIDFWANTAISVLSKDNDLQNHASADALINTVDEADAEVSLDQLEQIYRSKGCT